MEAVPGTIEVHSATEDSDEEEEHILEINDSISSQESTTNPGPSMHESEEKLIIKDKSKDITYISSNSNYDVNSPFEPDQDEEYQTVDGEHVTGDSEDTGDSQNKSLKQMKCSYTSDELSESDYEVETLEDAFRDDSILETSSNHEVSQVLQHKSNVGNLEEPQKDKIIVIFKDEKHFNDVMMKEKENVFMTSTKMQSILKSNVTPKTEQSVKDSKSYVPKIISSDIKLKPKDIVVNQTIPVKSARQPRKQTITPVERAGSEIIVQPLVYSVEENDREHSPVRNKRKRISEVLQISDDSDPEYTLKPIKKRKKVKYSKRGRPKNSVQITIIDTDEEEVIEVTDEDGSGDESSSTKENDAEEEERTEDTVENVPEGVQDKEERLHAENVKSPEQLTTEREENHKEANNPKDTDNVSDDTVAIKVQESCNTSTKLVKKAINSPRKNKCSFCPKTFPNVGTLRRHMSLHCRRNSLRSKKVETVNEQPQENDFKEMELQVKLSHKVEEGQKLFCKKCKLQFHSLSQYNRHLTIHKTNKQKTAPLVNKKKSPIKKNEPRFLRSNNQQIKTVSLEVPKKTTDTSKEDRFKCDYCSLTFDQRKNLFIHRKTHKLFPCRNCKSTFDAKVTLDEHLRKSCVAFRKSPRLTRTSKAIVCEQCNKAFLSQSSLETHKSVAHKVSNTVINTISRKKNLLYRKKTAHGGVPMSLKMQKAFNAVQKK